MSKKALTVFWFRRDLRIKDNAGLYYALRSGYPVLPLFIFDRAILDQLESHEDARVSFIYDETVKINKELEKLGAGLLVKYGFPAEVWKALLREYDVREVYANHDYEPYARERDKKVRGLLTQNGIRFYTHKDQAIFEKEEVMKGGGKPYQVFTPYKRQWLTKLNGFYLTPYPTREYSDNFAQVKISKPPFSLQEMGFKKSKLKLPHKKYEDILQEYGKKRDFPALDHTSHIGIHLRFGTLSIREVARLAAEKSESFLNELIWRDFYFMILWHFPHVAREAFKPEYNRIQWRNNEQEFKAWCNGNTGYPLVDAGMRQLNKTGFMHNRLRMVTASFLAKHLLIDWRWGEAYFASKLLDFELSSNNGGWQWSAGTGCDAAPYFRIFNPHEQAKKFDPEQKFIKKWVPDKDSAAYEEPIVEHKFARERCLKVYKAALNDT